MRRYQSASSPGKKQPNHVEPVTVFQLLCRVFLVKDFREDIRHLPGIVFDS